MSKRGPRIETRAVHAGREIDAGSGAVVSPIHMSTTYERDADGGYRRGYEYGRNGNPTRALLEKALASLEGGATSATFASGTAACLAVLHTVGPGGHVLATEDCYHGTLRQLQELLPEMGIEASLVDTTDLDSVRSGLRDNTRLIWVETPSNPLLRISDIAALAKLAHENGCRLACDNTFGTPVLQHPLSFGADYSVHSSTKYIGGHSDVTGGAVIAARDDGHFEKVRRWQSKGGAVPSPFDCWLQLRSLNTLPLRVRQQAASALLLAEFLQNHERVSLVHYPGLSDHSGHALAARQMRADEQPRCGGVLSFEVRGGEAAAMSVAARTQLFIRATSLGGVESLIEHRASVEGPDSKAPPGLLRLAVGIEHVEDLRSDLDQALAR
ncbi:MAG: aminotransferase class V-fold PLP-dependent enzyme [Gammaproteobacteria bacterium]|nr:aminotransferase class V-fold PLP-dependent enzyme [Gammaproteobacteria bacterium]